MSQQHFVEIVEVDTGKVVKRMGPHPERAAERIEAGVLINLNHDAYFVRTVPEGPVIEQQEVDWTRQDIDRRTDAQPYQGVERRGKR